jgi:hypothetical protein
VLSNVITITSTGNSTTSITTGISDKKSSKTTCVFYVVFGSRADN